MAKFKITRKADAEVVIMTMEDKGDVIPFYDESGTELGAAYTSFFKWGHSHDQMLYTQVRKDLADETGDAASFRLAEDEAHLEALGFDVTTIEMLN